MTVKYNDNQVQWQSSTMTVKYNDSQVHWQLSTMTIKYNDLSPLQYFTKS